ncbi:MAG: hypothetical protein ACO3A2_09890 [Bdellovibrionia bacterium]
MAPQDFILIQALGINSPQLGVGLIPIDMSSKSDQALNLKAP